MKTNSIHRIKKLMYSKYICHSVLRQLTKQLRKRTCINDIKKSVVDLVDFFSLFVI